MILRKRGNSYGVTQDVPFLSIILLFGVKINRIISVSILNKMQIVAQHIVMDYGLMTDVKN